MIIKETDKKFDLIEDNSFRRLAADGSISLESDRMLTESTVGITIDGAFAGEVPCTPQLLPELVLGWLLYEGFIGGCGDVDSISIDEDGTAAEVRLAGDPGEGKGLPARRPMRDVSPMAWRKEWIYALAGDFEIQLPLRRETRAAHNCRLATGRGPDLDILFRCEDIGRHSAIDKAVGWALRNDIDTTGCLLFSSGRISRAMVRKVIRAGIPVMAGKGTISKRAVQLAADHGLTLIGYARTDSLAIFTEPEGGSSDDR